VIIGVGGFLGIGEKEVSMKLDEIKRMVHSDGKTYFTSMPLRISSRPRRTTCGVSRPLPTQGKRRFAALSRISPD
jgi:hypothetical protein